MNIFLVLAKKAKLDDNQTLDLLYEKLSDKFKSLLVTKKRQTNLGDLIKKLRSMDASMKVISQRKRPAASAANTVNSKPVFTSSGKSTYQQVSQSASMTSVTTSTSASSTATGSHSRPMDLSSGDWRGPLSEEKKKRRNKLGLCKHCGQAGHIARDHSDPNTLLAKRRAAGINEMTVSPAPPIPASSSENVSSLSIVALGDH